MNKIKIKAFTLIELLIAITLISILALWISNIYFNSIWDKEKNNWFMNQIRTSIETIKNNAIIWKWVWNTIIVPDFWKINIKETSPSFSWAISYYYWTWSIITSTLWNIYDWFEIKLDNFQKITNLICANNKQTSTWAIDNIDILIEWKNLSLSWCSNDKKTIILTTEYKNFSKTISLNTINWVINY